MMVEDGFMALLFQDFQTDAERKNNRDPPSILTLPFYRLRIGGVDVPG